MVEVLILFLKGNLKNLGTIKGITMKNKNQLSVVQITESFLADLKSWPRWLNEKSFKTEQPFD